MSDMNGHDDAHGGLNAAVAATINGERAAAGLTQKELALRSGIHPKTVLRILNTQRDIDVNQLAQFASVFNLTPAEILEKAQERVRRGATTLLPDPEIEDGMVAYRRGHDSVPQPEPPPGKKSVESA